MQKKNDNFLEKIVKKDYNNELEAILEKKYFNEDVKSILLNILYKIETAYKDYKKVKQDTETKDEYIEKIIDIIKNECEEIKLVKPYSEESKIIGNKTFLVEKNKKRIICYNVERKLLYCISKISKQEEIVKNNYFLVNKTLSNLINTGNNINMVEPLRDFNGYSWTTIPREIESIEHNLIYQNLIILVGNKFLNNWIYNKEFVMDYMELFREKMEEIYSKKVAKDIIENLEKISILLEVKFDAKSKKEFLTIKSEIEKKIGELEDNKKFVESITLEKKRLTNEIKKIDETINDKNILNFNTEFDNLTKIVQEENKVETLRQLCKIYEIYVKFLEENNSSEQEKVVAKTKLDIFKAYSSLDDNNWEEISNYMKSASEEFSKLMTSLDMKEQKQYSINKSYIMINELYKATNIKDPKIFLIKYKNTLEELKNI